MKLYLKLTSLAILLLTNLQITVANKLWPLPTWPQASPVEVKLDPDQLKRARDYALTGGGAGYIIRYGKLAMSWGELGQRYDLKSTTKSIGVTALGLAIADGKIDLSDKVVQHHPALAVPPESNRGTGWIEQITITHLARQTAGFDKSGGYTKLIFAPGTKWSYSDGGPNWLAECLTLVYRQDLLELMFNRVFTPLGITHQDLTWRQNSYRPPMIDNIMRREFGAGISANVDAMARIGYLYLRQGRWNNRQIIPQTFVSAASTTVAEAIDLPELDPTDYSNASDHYGLLWWNNLDGTLDRVPTDAYWSWGLYDSLIAVIPSLDIVVARAGNSWQQEWKANYEVLKPFLYPIVAAVNDEHSLMAAQNPTDGFPYPPSPVIKGLEWAPVSTILRQAKGSDNWPITWGDDGRLYTAYGDGWGFEPGVETKLSMGLGIISGDPDNFEGENLRAPTAERLGGGASGPKVSGLLMVDGVLYMLVRNTGNSQLAWSIDRGQTWTWSDWKFTTSFGYPTFLNFGQNYAKARDEYIYIYSPDSESAYQRADRMVLARAPVKLIRMRNAYQFFKGYDGKTPVWTDDIDQRSAVFRHAKNCYRSSVSYNAALRRYLWCQTGSGADPRVGGGLAIYDASEPWGPWTTVFFTSQWDVGPGETSCLPTKWMSGDGRTIFLVFSGDDAFSVRKGTLTIVE
jgi:hypothetical protein